MSRIRSAAAGASACCVLAILLSFALAGSGRGEGSGIARGARIVALGNGRGAPACASCHALDGSGDPSGAFPRLSAEPALYTKNALSSFADGSRPNPVMTPIALALTDQERGDVAAYYASIAAPFPLSPPEDPEVVERGRTLANVGDNGSMIPACVSCHGPTGHSQNPTIPSLAGQYARYTLFELRMFREGYRRHGAGQMKNLAQALSAAQEHAVAAYLQSVGPVAAPSSVGGDAVRRP